MKYIITDWADNVCFAGKEFESFEDAWGFIYEQFPDDDALEKASEDGTLGDYYVVEAQGIRPSRYLDPNDPRKGLKVS